MEKVLMAFVTTPEKVCVVRANEVAKALIAVLGVPTEGVQGNVHIAYALRDAAEVAAIEEFDRAELDH